MGLKARCDLWCEQDGTQGAAFQNESFRNRFIEQMDAEVCSTIVTAHLPLPFGFYLRLHLSASFFLQQEDNIGRPGNVDEVARVVDFFAGPLGSFVSGEVLKVDGGVARL